MQKTICGKLYDTDCATIVRKKTCGTFGDPTGYEETLYVTDTGSYFLYTNGGEESPYPQPQIKRVSKAAAEKLLAEQE